MDDDSRDEDGAHERSLLTVGQESDSESLPGVELGDGIDEREKVNPESESSLSIVEGSCDSTLVTTTNPETPKVGAGPALFGRPTECALGNGVCVRSDPKAVKLLSEFIKQTDPEAITKTNRENTQKIVDTLKTMLGVKNESDIWRHPDFVGFVGEKQAQHYLDNYYAPAGPANNTNLISSININALMAQWNKLSKQKFNKKFYGLPYHMADFATRGTQLSRIDIPDLMKQGYDAFGVVMNTDNSSGEGEHWYCLYGDLQHKGTQADPIVIEYFNSSGNRLSGGKSGKYERMGIWLEELKHKLLRDHDIHARIHTSAARQLQYSNTECGVWSLCYIHARLSGHPPDYFDRKGVTDDDMYEYRKSLFRPE